jgi:histidyl-tRNA synthetase
MLGRLFALGVLDATRKSPTAVLVALANEEARANARAVAETLRSRGISTEVFDRPLKWGDQIKYADSKGIPYVWFPAGDKPDHEVRTLATRTQESADPAAWSPSPEHLRPAIVRKDG